MTEINRVVGVLARQQHGVIALWQLRDLGADKALAATRCRQRLWVSVGPGIYAINGAPRTFGQKVMAAVLHGGPDAVASHRTAARLHGIAGSMAVPVEVTVPNARNVALPGVIYHRVRDLKLGGRVVVDGIPVTEPGRTLLDVAAVEPARARRVMWEALRRDLVTWERILGVLVDHSRRGRPGLTVIRRLVNQHYLDIAGDSTTEDIAYELMIDSGRVLIPQRLVPVICADGVPVTPDFLWPEYRAVLEVWGVDHFRNEAVQQADALKANQLRLAGFALLIYSGKMLRRPDHFLRDVDQMLRIQGWDGTLTTCVDSERSR